VWAGVLIVMLALPVWMSWGPKAALHVLPARGEPAVVVMQAAPVSLATDALPIASPAQVSKPTPIWNWSAARSSKSMWIGVYLLGAFVLLLRLAIGTISANRLTGVLCAAPVTVGLLRPRILLPESSSEWPQAQLDAVLTHERAHVRRRDPLFQWLALLNRAVFWFHPLAWWLERKLSALAEEACDAAVLERGHDPREYSRYLLELARAVQRAGTRVNVVAMAMPGSCLPQRVKRIIEGVRAPRISPMRMACAALACAIPAIVFAAGTLDHAPQILRLPLPATPAPQPPVLLAQAPAQQPQAKAPEAPKPEFEVASVRLAPPPDGRTPGLRSSGVPGPNNTDPGRFSARLDVMNLVLIAYDIPLYRLSEPGDLYMEKLDVEAKMPVDTTREQFNVMLQNLLTDRVGLKVHWATQQIDMYNLVVAKGGPKFKLAAPDSPQASDDVSKNGNPDRVGPDGFPIPPPGNGPWMGAAPGGKMGMRGHNETISELARAIGPRTLDGPLMDATGLPGKYDYTIFWSMTANSAALRGTQATDDPDGPSIFDAVEEQLGLKIEKKKGPVQMLVVDHVEKSPTEN